LHEQAAIRVKFGPSVAKWRRSPLIGPIRDAGTSCTGKEKNPLTMPVNGSLQVERKGVEPSTSALRTQRSPN
jgi:hypothetical protein